MRIDLTEVTWLDAGAECSLSELAERSRLSEAELRELVEYGAIEPRDPVAVPQMFSGRAVLAARAASRLRDDFELDLHAIALALGLLERIEDLEAQLREFRLHGAAHGR